MTTRNELRVLFTAGEIYIEPKGSWKATYERMLNGPWPTHPDKYDVALNNPYYAAINATAFILARGNFRGYEHFASVFFDTSSKYFVGLRIHRERTRTDWSKGRYVTDWYIADGLRDFEKIYRATSVMLLMSEINNDPHLKTLAGFTINNDLNIRTSDNADQAPQITSG